jgi:hypothetical protein
MTFKTFLVSVIALFALLSCDNELNVTADFRTIPVIYALIDGNVETNYIRVEKGFIDPTIGGLDIAQRPDSLYFGSEVLVRITNMRTNKAVILDRVNLEDEGFTREDGIFATQPNIAYKLNIEDLELQQNEMLKFELIDASDNVMTSAESMVIGEFTLSNTQPVDPIRFIEDSDANFGIRSDEQAAAIFDLRLYITYLEEDLQTGTSEEKVLEWVIETGLPRTRTSAGGNFRSQVVFSFDGIEFYQFLGGAITDAPADENRFIRTFVGIDLRYDAGGQDLADYINIGNANTGITSNQIIPTFTNFSNDAVGVFSSRTTIRNVLPYGINTATLDSLRDGRFTEQLNFN